MTHSIIFSASYSLKPQSVLLVFYTYQQYFSLWTHPPFRLYLQACLLTSHAHLQLHLLARQFCLFTIKLLNLLSVSVCCVCLGPPCCFKEQRHVLNFKINTSLCEFTLVSEVRAVIDESVKVCVLMRRPFNTHQPEYRLLCFEWYRLILNHLWKKMKLYIIWKHKASLFKKKTTLFYDIKTTAEAVHHFVIKCTLAEQNAPALLVHVSMWIWICYFEVASTVVLSCSSIA